MKLYLVSINPSLCPKGQDIQVAVIVRAKNVTEARKVAAKTKGDEGKAIWLEPMLSTCVPIKAKGEESLILRNFHNG